MSRLLLALLRLAVPARPDERAPRRAGGASGTVDVEIVGLPVSGGGVQMTSGTITVSDGHSSFRGDIVGLNGGDIQAQMPGPNGADWVVEVALTQLDRTGGKMAGRVQASPASSVGGNQRSGRGDDDR